MEPDCLRMMEHHACEHSAGTALIETLMEIVTGSQHGTAGTAWR
jgi:hypothetical protein